MPTKLAQQEPHPGTCHAAGCSNLFPNWATGRRSLNAGLYCSKRCLWRICDWQKRGIEPVDMHCPHCGAFVEVGPSATRVCRGCKGKDFRYVAKGPQPRTCVECGSTFHSALNTAKYCNKRCRGIRQRGSASNERSQRRRRARKKGAVSEPYTIREIGERDGWRCHICKTKTWTRYIGKHYHPKKPTVDHIVPLSKGGTDLKSNVAIACYLCNTAKGDRSANDQLRLIG